MPLEPPREVRLETQSGYTLSWKAPPVDQLDERKLILGYSVLYGPVSSDEGKRRFMTLLEILENLPLIVSKL